MFENYVDLLKSELDNYRFIHSIGVAETAKKLAEKYGCDPVLAYKAGLLHDVTKNMSDDRQLKIFSDFDIMLTPLEMQSPQLWHSISGAAYAKHVLREDNDTVSAIRYHTTGKAGMKPIEEIVYLTDFISPDRKYPDVDIVRGLADVSLSKAIIYTLSYTINNLVEKGRPVHPDTLAAYNFYILKEME